MAYIPNIDECRCNFKHDRKCMPPFLSLLDIANMQSLYRYRVPEQYRLAAAKPHIINVLRLQTVVSHLTVTSLTE